MLNIAFLLILVVSSMFATPVFADAQINIVPPSQGINPTTPIGLILSNLLTIILIGGIIAVLFMLAIGGFEWITSGGDKDAVAKARGRIINAVVGLVILAIAFLVTSTAGSIVGINLLNSTLPRLDSVSTGQVGS